MTDRLFLEILKTALSGKQMPADTQLSCEQMDEIVRLSELHRLLPMVYDCTYSICPYDESAHEKLRKSTKLRVLQQTVRTESFLRTYTQLQKKGLEPIVVKGIVCRSLYPNPDLRFSADEDLLICADESEVYEKTLNALGFRQQAKPREDYYETSYFSDEGLHLEVHTSLFSTEIEYFEEFNRIFENSRERACYVEIDSVKIRTLSPTDNLIYLILHSLKHFVHSGVGIRQVCDIIMFAQTWSNNIDWDAVVLALQNLSAERYAAGIFAIGSKYLGFDKDSSGYPDALKSISVDEDVLLGDILCAGVYGNSTMSRRHSAGITLDAVQGNKESVIHRLFPSGENLDNRFEYAKKNSLLLPVAWVHRIIGYMSEIDVKGGNVPSETLKTGRERIEILRNLGLLSEEK